MEDYIREIPCSNGEGHNVRIATKEEAPAFGVCVTCGEPFYLVSEQALQRACLTPVERQNEQRN